MKNLDHEKPGPGRGQEIAGCKKDLKTVQYTLLILKRLKSKPSEKILIEAFQEDGNLLKNKNEFESDK